MKNHKKKGARASLTAHQQLEGKSSSPTSSTSQQQSEEKSCSRTGSAGQQQSAGARANSSRLRKKSLAEQQAPKKSILSREAAAMALILGLTLTSHAPLAGYKESFSDQAAYLKPRQEARAKLDQLLRETDNLSAASIIESGKALETALGDLNGLDSTTPDKDAIENAITAFKTALEKRLADFGIDPKDKSSTLVPLTSLGSDKMKLVLKNIKDFYGKISAAKEKAQEAIEALTDPKEQKELTKELRSMAKGTLGVMQAVLPANVAANIPSLSEYRDMVKAAQPPRDKAGKGSSVATPLPVVTPPPSTPPPTGTLTAPTLALDAAQITALNNLKAVTGGTTSVDTLKLSDLQAMKDVFDAKKAELVTYVTNAEAFNRQETAAGRSNEITEVKSDDGSTSISFADVKDVSGLGDIATVNNEIAKLTTAPEFNSGNKLTPDQIAGLGVLKALVDVGNVENEIKGYDLTRLNDISKMIDVCDLVKTCHDYKKQIDDLNTRDANFNLVTLTGHDLANLPNAAQNYNNIKTRLEMKRDELLADKRPELNDYATGKANLTTQESEILTALKTNATNFLTSFDVPRLQAANPIIAASGLLEKLHFFNTAVTNWNAKNSGDQVLTTIPLDDGNTFDLANLPAADLATTQLNTVTFSAALDAAIAVKTGLDVGTLTMAEVTEAIGVIATIKKTSGYNPKDFKIYLLGLSQENINKIKVVTDVALLTNKALNNYKAQLETYEAATGNNNGVAKRSDNSIFNITADQIENLRFVVSEKTLIDAYAAYLDKRDALFTGFNLTFQDDAKHPVLTITKADSNPATLDEIKNGLHIAGVINVKMNDANLVPFLFKGPKGDVTGYNEGEVNKRYTEVKTAVNKLNAIFGNQNYKDLMIAQGPEKNLIPLPSINYENVIYNADILSTLNVMAQHCEATGQLKTDAFATKTTADLEAIRSSIKQEDEIRKIFAKFTPVAPAAYYFFTEKYDVNLPATYGNLNSLLALEKVKDAQNNEVESIFKPGSGKMDALKALCNVEEFMKKLTEAIKTAEAAEAGKGKGSGAPTTVIENLGTKTADQIAGELKAVDKDKVVEQVKNLANEGEKKKVAKAAVKSVTDNLTDSAQVEKAAAVLLAVAETMDASAIQAMGQELRAALPDGAADIKKAKESLSQNFITEINNLPKEQQEKASQVYFEAILKPKDFGEELKYYENIGLKGSELNKALSIDSIKIEDLLQGNALKYIQDFINDNIDEIGSTITKDNVKDKIKTEMTPLLKSLPSIYIDKIIEKATEFIKNQIP